MQTLFDRFGGTRPMAKHLSEAPSTVNGWKAEGRIPATKQPSVLAKAEELRLPVSAVDIIFPLGRPDREELGADAAPNTATFCGRCGETVTASDVATCSQGCPMRVADAA